MIDVFAAQLNRRFSKECLDPTWLSGEAARLIAAGEWAQLGGLMVQVALGSAPIASPLARIAAAAEIPPRSEAPTAWTDGAWVAAELALHVAAVRDALLAGGNAPVQGLALRAAGAVARVTL